MKKRKFKRSAVVSAVAKIRQEGKKELISIDRPFIQSEQQLMKTLRQAESGTIKTSEEKERFKQELSESREKFEQLKKEKPIRQLRKAGSRVATTTEAALEKGLVAAKKFAQKRVTSKRILRPSRLTISLKEREIENVFDDPNRFFKNEMEEAKGLFFK